MSLGKENIKPKHSSLLGWSAVVFVGKHVACTRARRSAPSWAT